MRRPVVLLIVALCALASARPSRAQVPHLTGDVNIAMSQGMLTGDVCLSSLPQLDTLHFLLHRGLNIKAIRDSTGRVLTYDGWDSGRMAGEGVEYTVTDSVRPLQRFCVQYVGAFPVYEAPEKAYHSKGAIAFNGETFRATEESQWYPILYDPREDRLAQNVTYRLHVRCHSCRSIYVNGDRPRPGPEITATSTVPRALLLFAGNFSSTQVDGTWFIHSSVADGEVDALNAKIAMITRFYENFLALRYGDRITFLDFEPAERFHPGQSWAFTTWPTMAFAQPGLEELAKALQHSDRAGLHLLAHEMAHYYFGTRLQPRGAYFWFYCESTAEYLALKAVQRLAGDDAYSYYIGLYYRNISKQWDREPPIPLDQIDHKDAMGQLYYYRYGPLLLVALEHEIGVQRMGALLHAILTAPSDTRLDYAYLHRAALHVGVSEQQWDTFERQCVRPSPTSSCLRALVGTSSASPRRHSQH